MIGKRIIVIGADWASVAIGSNNTDDVITYTVTGNITNGSLTGSSSIVEGGSVILTIAPNSGYMVPADVSAITISGATITGYSNGQLTIANPTSNVTITTTCTLIEEEEEESNEIDISDSFVFVQGGVVIDTAKSTFAGLQTNQTAYRANQEWVDVSDYVGSTLKITVTNAIGSAHVMYGMMFYSGAAKANAMADTAVPLVYETASNGVYAVDTVEVTIPTGATHFRTTWMPETAETELGVAFSAKIITQ